MDFASLPPEVNSGLMYSGPGVGPMLGAAAGWQAIAAALESAASGYASVISGLAGLVWSGPTALLMAAAVAPYVQWLTATAGQAAQTGVQAYTAAAAYEAAFVATVPPPAIAANRAQLAALLATNFFGQNAPTIAATEALYIEMWAQDAAAMYGYAGASAVASTLTPFSSPPRIANPAGQGAQTHALAQVVGNTGSVHTQSLTQLSSPTAAGVDPPLPVGSTLNVAPGGATVANYAYVTVGSGAPLHFDGAAFGVTRLTPAVIQYASGYTVTLPADDSFTLAGSGNILSGTIQVTGGSYTIPSGAVTGATFTYNVGAEVTVNAGGLVTAINSGVVTTSGAVTPVTPIVPVVPAATSSAGSAGGLGAALPPAGGLAGTSGIQPQLNADLLSEWARGLSGTELLAGQVGVPG